MKLSSYDLAEATPKLAAAHFPKAGEKRCESRTVTSRLCGTALTLSLGCCICKRLLLPKLSLDFVFSEVA